MAEFCETCGQTIREGRRFCIACRQGIPTISLWEPWATMIALGFKAIETRIHDRFQCLVGERIAIATCAGKRDRGVADVISTYNMEAAIIAAKVKKPKKGHVLCTAMVDQARYLYDRDRRQALCDCKGRFGLFLGLVHRLTDPVPVSGAQGVWKWYPQRSVAKVAKPQAGLFNGQEETEA